MKTLYEGILKGMDDTLKSGESDIAAASKDVIINGITDKDAKKQTNAIKLFKDMLEDHYAMKYKTHTNFNKRPESWWVQFGDKLKEYEFIMVRRIGSFYYIVSIDKLGNDPKYDRHTSHRTVATCLSPKYDTLYEVDDTMPELDDMCDKILRIMYMR